MSMYMQIVMCLVGVVAYCRFELEIQAELPHRVASFICEIVGCVVRDGMTLS